MSRPDMEARIELIPAEDGKLRVCLSLVAKWIAGVAATVAGALVMGAFAFAWQSNAAMANISARLDSIDARLEARERADEKDHRRMDRFEDRLLMQERDKK